MANNQDFPSIPLAHQGDRELFDWVVSRVDDGADDHSILEEYRKLHPDLKGIERNIAFIKFVLYYLYVTKYPKLTFYYYGFEADMMVVSQMSEGEKRDRINKYLIVWRRGKRAKVMILKSFWMNSSRMKSMIIAVDLGAMTRWMTRKRKKMMMMILT